MSDGSNLLAQETEFKLLASLLPHVSGMFVDVGAEQGSWSRFLSSHGLKGISFEPLPKHRSALAELARARAVRNYPWAIDERDGKAEFHIACDELGRPLDHFHSLQRLDRDGRVRHQRSIEVTCRSLASLHAEGLVELTLSVLKIDTEGNDLRVLRGVGPVRAEVIICEFFTKGIYEGWLEADPLGLIAEAQKLGYSRWIAVRRIQLAELISICPVAFAECEWGNVFFLTERLFASAQAALGRIVLEAELRIVDAMKALKRPRRRRWFSKR